MSDVSSEYVPVDPETPVSPDKKGKKHVTFFTPESSASAENSGARIEEISPDISFVFRPQPKSDDKQVYATREPPKARKSLDFKKFRVSSRNKDFRNALYKVLKVVRKDQEISKKAMDVMNDIMVDLFERLALAGADLAKKEGKETLGLREIKSGVALLLPGELRKHAINEGWKAMVRTQDASSDGRA